MNKMYLTLGDYSHDGHGFTSQILLRSNLSVDKIRKAYFASRKLTKVTFDHGENSEDYERVATEYEECTLSEKALFLLEKHGLTKAMLKKWGVVDFYLTEGSFAQLWIWFVKLSLPSETIIEMSTEEEYPSINTGPNSPNVQFGYGLFSS